MPRIQFAQCSVRAAKSGPYLLQGRATWSAAATGFDCRRESDRRFESKRRSQRVRPRQALELLAFVEFAPWVDHQLSFRPVERRHFEGGQRLAVVPAFT